MATKSKMWVRMTPGDMVREARRAQEMSQTQLCKAAGLSQPILSGIESGRVALGAERAKRLAVALKVHPSVLLFPQWEEEAKEIAAEMKARSPKARSGRPKSKAKAA
jgi:transcriptional regulator with XRE-family HTH domain